MDLAVASNIIIMGRVASRLQAVQGQGRVLFPVETEEFEGQGDVMMEDESRDDKPSVLERCGNEECRDKEPCGISGFLQIVDDDKKPNKPNNRRGKRHRIRQRPVSGSSSVLEECSKENNPSVKERNDNICISSSLLALPGPTNPPMLTMSRQEQEPLFFNLIPNNPATTTTTSKPKPHEPESTNMRKSRRNQNSLQGGGVLLALENVPSCASKSRKNQLTKMKPTSTGDTDSGRVLRKPHTRGNKEHNIAGAGLMGLFADNAASNEINRELPAGSVTDKRQVIKTGANKRAFKETTEEIQPFTSFLVLVDPSIKNKSIKPQIRKVLPFVSPLIPQPSRQEKIELAKAKSGWLDLERKSLRQSIESNSSTRNVLKPTDNNKMEKDKPIEPKIQPIDVDVPLWAVTNPPKQQQTKETPMPRLRSAAAKAVTDASPICVFASPISSDSTSVPDKRAKITLEKPSSVPVTDQFTASPTMFFASLEVVDGQVLLRKKAGDRSEGLARDDKGQPATTTSQAKHHSTTAKKSSNQIKADKKPRADVRKTKRKTFNVGKRFNQKKKQDIDINAHVKKSKSPTKEDTVRKTRQSTKYNKKVSDPKQLTRRSLQGKSKNVGSFSTEISDQQLSGITRRRSIRKRKPLDRFSFMTDMDPIKTETTLRHRSNAKGKTSNSKLQNENKAEQKNQRTQKANLDAGRKRKILNDADTVTELPETNPACTSCEEDTQGEKDWIYEISPIVVGLPSITPKRDTKNRPSAQDLSHAKLLRKKQLFYGVQEADNRPLQSQPRAAAPVFTALQIRGVTRRSNSPKVLSSPGKSETGRFKFSNVEKPMGNSYLRMKLGQPPIMEVVNEEDKRQPAAREKKSPKRLKSNLMVRAKANKEEFIVSNEDGWTAQEVKVLRGAYARAHALSRTFWDDIALRLEGRTASECREKWFSLVKTPLRKGHTQKNKSSPDTPASFLDSSDDERSDILSPSEEVAALAEKRLNIGGLPNLNFGAGSPIRFRKKSVVEVVENCDDGEQGEDLMTKDIREKPGYITYIRECQKKIRIAKKQENKKKKAKKEKKPLSKVSEKFGDGDIAVDGALSPGGTLRVQTHYDDEDDDIVFQDDGDESEDEDL